MNFYDGPPNLGATFAIEDLNNCGGLLGGRPLEIVKSDYKTDVNLVEGAAQQLIDEGVDFIHTAFDYDFANATARLANESGILNFGGAGSTLFGLENLGPLTFNIWHGNPTEAAVIASFMQEKGWTKPYILQDVTIQYSKEVCDIAEAKLAELGITPVGKNTFQNADASFSSQVSGVRDAADADVVLVCSFAPGGATMIKQLRDAGVELPIVGAAGGLDGTFWQEAVPDISNYYAAGAVFSIYGDDPNPALNELSARVEEATGSPPAIGHAALGYAYIQALGRAIERAGTIDAQAVKAELEKFTDEPLIVGPTTWTPECHVPYGRPLAVIEFTDGQPKWIETIDPGEVATVQC
jgi:branched-chain amino acid transport system substrate-binding protein